MPASWESEGSLGVAPYRSLTGSVPSVFVEVENCGIVQILRFSRIDDHDFSWRTIRVRKVDVPVLDHGSIGGIDDGVKELVFDLMEFGVSHTKALLGDSIVSIHEAIQHRSIRGLGHCVGSFPLCEWADWCRVGHKRDRLTRNRTTWTQVSGSRCPAQRRRSYSWRWPSHSRLPAQPATSRSVRP